MVKSKVEEIILSDEQQTAVNEILQWFNSRSFRQQIFTLVGYAGTGKSTIISYLKKKLPQVSIAYATYTGKASSVLKKKLSMWNVYPDYVGTIHGLIYYPQVDDKGNVDFILKNVLGDNMKEDDYIEFGLIVIDESSMVNDDLFKDLMSFDVPILFVGDNGQLPPVKGSSIIHLDKPDVKLNTIHRQAKDNPIIKLSCDIREGKKLKYGKYADNVYILNFSDNDHKGFIDDVIKDYKIDNDIMICGMNKTRCFLNASIKKSMFNKGLIQDENKVSVGDKVICLKNNKGIGIFNGMLGFVKKIDYDPLNYSSKGRHSIIYKMTVNFDGYDITSYVNANQFLSKKTLMYDNTELQKKVKLKIELFDFGYCITCHKSQGSEFKNVIIFREPSKLWEQKLWDYTAVTRAIDNVCMIYM